LLLTLSLSFAFGYRARAPRGPVQLTGHPTLFEQYFAPLQLNTTMPVKEALAELDDLRPGEQFSYRALAKKYSCSRTTLTRQHKGQAPPREDTSSSHRLLHPRDEAELVKYIRGLTERHLMPTRQMIINFATPLCAWEPSDSWVTRFLRRHFETLLTAWSTPMASVRHQADSGEKYKQYFDLLHRKIAEYKVLPENM
jgi:hypothetical protein